MRLDAEVTGIGLSRSRPVVHVRGHADLVPDLAIGADGVHSICRETLVGHPHPPTLSGDMAYRCVVMADRVATVHPALAPFLESSGLHYWIGPGQHVVCYQLRNGNLWNVVIACTEDRAWAETAATSTSTTIAAMMDKLQGWDPNLRHLVSLAEDGRKGPLMRVGGLDSWIHPTANFALLGDACHATLPYL